MTSQRAKNGKKQVNYKIEQKMTENIFEILVILSDKQANRQKTGWEKFKRHFP